MKKCIYIQKSPVFIGALLFFMISLHLNAHQNISHHSSSHFPNPIKKILFKRQKNNKIAAALAFPFPFGCVGLHRVYLGTAAHVPIVYAATAGGVFGIIPLLDCIVLLSQKDITDYENNNNVIMWISPSASTNTSDVSK